MGTVCYSPSHSFSFSSLKWPFTLDLVFWVGRKNRRWIQQFQGAQLNGSRLFEFKIAFFVFSSTFSYKIHWIYISLSFALLLFCIFHKADYELFNSLPGIFCGLTGKQQLFVNFPDSSFQRESESRNSFNK